MRPAPGSSRRRLLANALVAATGMATTLLSPRVARAAFRPSRGPEPSSEWDLSWLQRLEGHTDRALFDWPVLGEAADPQLLWFAERYLDGCRAVYGASPYRAIVVLNIRTLAVPAALHDDLWKRFGLGAEIKATDPFTNQPATRNPFWHDTPEPAPGVGTTSLARFVNRGAILLVCDTALGHLASRLAATAQRAKAEVHAELRRGLVPGAYAMPSGVFGMAKAQNAGCALVKV